MSSLIPDLPAAFGDTFVHEGAVVCDRSPLRVVTPPAQWSYAVSFGLNSARRDGTPARADASRLILELHILRGRLGVGWTTSTGDAFISERFTGGAGGRTVVTMPAGAPLGRLVIRNASDTGASEFVLRQVQLESLSHNTIRYPVSVIPREFETEARPEGGGTDTFDTVAARALNLARLEWLEAAGLPLDGTRVLDAGTGVGHFIPHYRSRGCTVVAVDGRQANIEEVRRRHPGVDAHEADVQAFDSRALGTFDVVHCVGLLYHLDSPVSALRRFHALCRRFLVLETMVCDAADAVTVLVDETKTFSQALAGLGSRPSPSFLALALNRVGFRYVYGASPPPRHEDFEFEWLNDLAITRDGHPLRCMFIASHEPLSSPLLLPLIE